MVAIRTMPPLLMSSVRFLVAGAVLYVWARRREPGASVAPDGRQWLAAGTTGFALLLIGSGGIAWAEQRLDSGVAALLGASIPLWIALLDRLVFGSRLSRAAMVGLGIGLAGVFVLVGPASNGVNLVGAAAILVSSLGWAAGSLHARSSPLPRSPLLAAGDADARGRCAARSRRASRPARSRRFASRPSRPRRSARSPTSSSAARWSPTRSTRGCCGTRRPRVVTTHAYVNPAVAVLLGWAVLAEPLTRSTLVAGGRDRRLRAADRRLARRARRAAGCSPFPRACARRRARGRPGRVNPLPSEA